MIMHFVPRKEQWIYQLMLPFLRIRAQISHAQVHNSPPFDWLHNAGNTCALHWIDSIRMNQFSLPCLGKGVCCHIDWLPCLAYSKETTYEVSLPIAWICQMPRDRETPLIIYKNPRNDLPVTSSFSNQFLLIVMSFDLSLFGDNSSRW